MSELRCHHCSEPIGVYEPLIALISGKARETSRAAELQLASGSIGECFHRACFEQLHERPPPSD